MELDLSGLPDKAPPADSAPQQPQQDGLAIDLSGLPDKVPVMSDPVPFDLDGHFNESTQDLTPDEAAEKKGALGEVLGMFAQPFVAQGYNSMAALNRGAASFYSHLDSIAKFLEAAGAGESSGIFDKIEKNLSGKSDYWKKRANEVGSGFIDEVVGEAIGGAIPGIASFSLDVASGLTFPAMAGAQEGKEAGQNPVVAGLVKAAETGTMHQLFKMINPLAQYLRAPTMGTIFGIQEAQHAPEGEKGKAFAKGAMIGAGYSLTSPGGHLGLNEIERGVREQIGMMPRDASGRIVIEERKQRQAASPSSPSTITDKKKEEQQPVEKMAEEQVIPPGIDPMEYNMLSAETKPPTGAQQKQRKFLKTVEESEKTTAGLKEKVAAVDPQNYDTITNADSMAKAALFLEEKGIQGAVDHVLSEAPLSAEKAAIGVSLMDHFQKAGDYERATQITEAIDKQAREGGRFTQLLSIWSRGSADGFIKSSNRQLDNLRSRYNVFDNLTGKKVTEFTLNEKEIAEIRRLHREANAATDPTDRADLTLQMIDVVAKKVPPSFSERFDAYRYQNMLSSPKTHLRNMFENLGNAYITRPYDLTTLAAIDYVKSWKTGKEREYYMSDVPVYMKAAVNAVPNAIEAFKQTWNMVGDNAKIGKPEVGINIKTSLDAARMKQMPKSLTIISRLLEATDKFNLAILGAGETARLLKNGKTQQEAYAGAQKVAEQYLYREQLPPEQLSVLGKSISNVGEWIFEARNKKGLFGKTMQWFVPFIKTPVNKAIQMVERSPLALVRDPKQMADTEVLARSLGGSIIMGIGAMMAATGETTWSAPAGEEQKAWFYNVADRLPYSVKIGDTWVPFWYFGPFALAFGLPAAAKFYYEQRAQSITGDNIDNTVDMLAGIAKLIGSQSSTQSIGVLFNALNGDESATLTNQLGFTVQQVIPAAGMVRYINTILDPVYRKPDGLVESIEANIPFLSDKLNARLSPFMEESRRDPLNYILPYDVGRSDSEYAALYPMQQAKERQDFLNSRMDRITTKMRKNEMTVDESIEEMQKIMEAEQKAMEEVK